MTFTKASSAACLAASDRGASFWGTGHLLAQVFGGIFASYTYGTKVGIYPRPKYRK
jgi:hypothetical protein